MISPPLFVGQSISIRGFSSSVSYAAYVTELKKKIKHDHKSIHLGGFVPSLDALTILYKGKVEDTDTSMKEYLCKTCDSGWEHVISEITDNEDIGTISYLVIFKK